MEQTSFNPASGVSGRQVPNAPVLVKIWDCLVAIGVVFPLLTGGIWIERPGYFLELSDLGIPVLLVGFTGVVLKRVFRQPVEKSFFLRVSASLLENWRQLLETRTQATLWAGAAVVGTLLASVSAARHWSFHSNASDLGIFTNALWNLTHGGGYVSSVKDGMNLFADHQSPLFWILAPVFWIFPRPETLLLIQAFGLAAGGVAAFSLARQYFPGDRVHWAAAVVPLLYWTYLPMRNANHFDFHPEVFMLPLFLAAVAGLQGKTQRARWGGALALILAIGAKESAAAVAAGLGIAWILGASPEGSRGFTRRAGIVIAALGVAIFYFDLQVVPRIFGAQYAYGSQFSDFGSGIGDILLSPFTKPEVFFTHLAGRARLKFLFFTLAPLGFLPILNPRAFVAALPGYLMIFLSAGDRRVSLDFHYGIEPAVGLFFALPGVLAHLARSGADGWKLRVWMLFWGLGAFGRSEMYRLRRYGSELGAHIQAEAVMKCVRPDAAVAATNAWIPHLAARHWANYMSNLKLPAGGAVDCVIEDRSVDHWPLTEADTASILKELPSRNYQEIWKCGTIQVFQYSGARSCLDCAPPCP